MRHFWSLPLALLALFTCPVSTLAAPALPDTPKHTVEDVYHGQTVRDDYRWLEPDDGPGVQAWSDAENAVARDFIDGIPERKDILARVNELTHSRTPSYYGLVVRGGRTFADQGPAAAAAADAGRVRVDRRHDQRARDRRPEPDRHHGRDRDRLLRAFARRLEGRGLDVEVRQRGRHRLRVRDRHAASACPTSCRTSTAAPRADRWRGTRTERASGARATPPRASAPRKTCRSGSRCTSTSLGDPASADTYVLGKEFPKIAEVALETSDDGRHVLCNVSNGDGGEHGFWLAGADGVFREVTTFRGRVRAGEVRRRRALPPVARGRRAERQAAADRARAGRSGGHARRRARRRARGRRPRSRASCPRATACMSRTSSAARPRIRLFDALGRPKGAVALPPITSVGGMVREHGDVALIRTESYTEPARWWRYDPGGGKLAADRAHPALARDVRRRRGHARVRHVEGRHEGPDQS